MLASDSYDPCSSSVVGECSCKSVPNLSTNFLLQLVVSASFDPCLCHALLCSPHIYFMPLNKLMIVSALIIFLPTSNEAVKDPCDSD